MPDPKLGAPYRHTAELGLGQRARIADPDVPEVLNTLSSESAELDMPAGAVVTVCGFDEDRGLVLVGWMDRRGTPRITSIAAGDLDQHFEEV